MDGFAVRWSDLRACAAGASGGRGARLRVVGEARAGGPRPRPLGAGEALRIMTGAPLPAGADAVVPREAASAVNGTVSFTQAPRRGDFVRPRGADFRAGELLLRRGARLGAFELALLATQGIARVRVVGRPRVAVLSTGDELVPLSRRPGAGRIRDASGPALAALIGAWGHGVLRPGICADEPSSLAVALRAAARDAEVLVILGGVSVGDHDHAQEALDLLGWRRIFWRVAIRPGKPLLFGRWDGRLVFGLPGNPVSSLVCAQEFLRPALERLSGSSAGPEPYPLRGRLTRGWEKPAALRQFLFCRARSSGGGWALAPVRPQGSAYLGMASRADALAVVPEGRASLKAGAVLRFRWL